MKSLITISLLLFLQSCATYVAHQGLALRAAASMEETKVEGKVLGCKHNDGKIEDWLKGEGWIEVGGCYTYTHTSNETSAEAKKYFNDRFSGGKLKFVAFNGPIRHKDTGKILRGKTCMIFFYNSDEKFTEKKWTYREAKWLDYFQDICHVFEE